VECAKISSISGLSLIEAANFEMDEGTFLDMWKNCPRTMFLTGLRIRIRIRMDPLELELLDPDPGGQK
jgi:hypothetical protein